MHLKKLVRKYVGDRAFYAMVLGVAVPIMIQNGITNFVSMLDNIMVGQMGTESMSGVAIVNQLLFVFSLCVFGGVSGAGIFGAQFYGNGNHEGLRSTLRWLGRTLAKLIRIGNENSLVVWRKGEELFSLPVTVCVVLLMCSVGTVLLFALAVGLFCGLRYSFRGPNLGKESINSAMDRAAEAAETVKEEIRSAGSEKKSQQEKGEDESK